MMPAGCPPGGGQFEKKGCITMMALKKIRDEGNPA